MVRWLTSHSDLLKAVHVWAMVHPTVGGQQFKDSNYENSQGHIGHTIYAMSE